MLNKRFSFFLSFKGEAGEVIFGERGRDGSPGNPGFSGGPGPKGYAGRPGEIRNFLFIKMKKKIGYFFPFHKKIDQIIVFLYFPFIHVLFLFFLVCFYILLHEYD